MENLTIIDTSGDKTITFEKQGRYMVFLDNVSGVFRFEIEVPLVELTILGAYQGKNESSFHLRTIQHHRSPNSTSNLFIKAVLEDSSQLHYRGLIRIEENCNGTHAYQKNQNLVMSDKVRVTSEPDLEILSNDVFCTHGSTTGGPSADSLYFLQTRGVPLTQAVKLIKEGFLQDIYDLMSKKTPTSP